MTDTNLPTVNMPSMNYFEQYGATASMNMITGTLIKFAKGDWLMGQEEEEVKADRQFVCVMDDLQIGWTKWVDNKPAAQHMGKLAEGFAPPRRNELGDDDESMWDVDTSGNPRDPWQFTNSLIMKTPGKSGADEADLFTFSTSSKGGINAIGDLCKAYVRMLREKGPGNPIVTLSSSSYKHSNPEYGRIKKPMLNIVGWEPLKAAAPAIEAPEETEEPAPKKTRGKK